MLSLAPLMDIMSFPDRKSLENNCGHSTFIYVNEYFDKNIDIDYNNNQYFNESK